VREEKSVVTLPQVVDIIDNKGKKAGVIVPGKSFKLSPISFVKV
jgi:hypothetical protein